MTVLLHRIEELDADLYSTWPLDVMSAIAPDAASRLEHYVDVMSRCTDSFIEVEAGPLATIKPETADAVVRRSRLVEEIEGFDSSLVTGPMDKSRQHWTPIRGSAWNGEAPSAQRFIPPRIGQPARVKPSGFGLYTATASVAGISMWRTLLGPGGSMMLPLPRYTWELGIDDNATIAEIGSATAWVEFVCAYSRTDDGLVYPDWASVAYEWDAIHVTLPVIAAAQGFHLSTPCGVIPPAFWDVEFTFWLRWCFSGARLVERVPTMPARED